MCYDYAHLNNLSNISANRNHNAQQCKTQIPQNILLCIILVSSPQLSRLDPNKLQSRVVTYRPYYVFQTTVMCPEVNQEPDA